MSYTPALEKALSNMERIATQGGYAYIGTEHLLAALLETENTYAGQLLRDVGVDREEIRRMLSATPGRSATRKVAPRRSEKLEAVLQNAREEAGEGQRLTGSEHVLFALLSDASCAAYRYIAALCRDTGELFRQTEALIENDSRSDLIHAYHQPSAAADPAGAHLLEQLTLDMTHQAAMGSFSPLIGRENELSQLIRVLMRKSKNNPCLLGEAGVGKTAVVEGLAKKINDGDVPRPLLGHRILSLNFASVVAGTKYRGEFEQKLREIIQALEADPTLILFVDEIHTVMGAGGADGAIDASNILKPALARGTLRLIGATTYDEYRRFIEKDKAMERRFAPISIREPTQQQALQMLEGLRPGMEAHHAVRITPQALQAAVTLSARYIKDRYLPDKAIDLIDEGAARKRAQNGYVSHADFSAAVQRGDLQRARELSAKSGAPRRALRLTAQDIAQLLTEKSGIPVGDMARGERKKLRALPAQMNKMVFGQAAAVSQICDTVAQKRLGLGNPRTPIASFLFVGESGSGKVSTAMALCRALFGDEDALLRFALSDISTKASLATLIGAPPGYVGYEENGKLTEAVRRRPYSVLLFDHAQDAAPAVFALLTRICADGEIKDAAGRSVDFSGTIVILTADLPLSKGGQLGFSPREAQPADAKAVCRTYFPDTLLSALDAVVPFSRLSKESLTKIAEKEMKTVQTQAAKVGVEVKCSAAVFEQLGARAWMLGEGSAGVTRIIREEIASQLSKKLLHGKALGKDGAVLQIGVCDGGGISITEGKK